MDNETPAVRNSRLKHYGIYGGIGVALASVLFFFGEPLNLILLKTASLPLFFVAQCGVDRIFASEASRTLWTTAYWERAVLDSVVFMCWLTIMGWGPDASTLRLAVTLFIGIVGMTAVKPVVEIFTRKLGNKASR
jgi:hypothetical protein